MKRQRDKDDGGSEIDDNEMWASIGRTPGDRHPSHSNGEWRK
jgi:hypothetical protein